LSSIDVKLDLHPGQKAVFDCPKRFIVVVAGRRFGKSWLACVRAITSALDERNEQKMPVGLIAPTYPTARTIYWKRLHEMAGGLVANANVNLGIVELVNGVEIHIKGADRPDSLRGVGWWDVVIDEFADQKVDVWELIVRPALSDAARFGGGRALFIGTPKGRNHFYALAEQAHDDTTGEWALFQFTSADNPFIPATEIESAVKSLSSSAFRQEYMASFESAGGAVFQRSWLKYGPEPKDGRFYIAVDLAGFADTEKQSMARASRADETAISVVKVYDGGWWVADVIHGRWNIKDTADRIAMAVKKYEPVALGVEKGALHKAVEPYLVESMRKMNVMVTIQPLTHGNKSKIDRIVWSLQGRFEHGGIKLCEGASWVAEFTDQLVQFPARTVHDDLIDSLSYIDQLVVDTFWDGLEEDPADAWQPMDSLVGY
jgi:predicted phage terminase large subunit-like protein